MQENRRGILELWRGNQSFLTPKPILKIKRVFARIQKFHKQLYRWLWFIVNDGFRTSHWYCCGNQGSERLWGDCGVGRAGYKTVKKLSALHPEETGGETDRERRCYSDWVKYLLWSYICSFDWKLPHFSIVLDYISYHKIM